MEIIMTCIVKHKYPEMCFICQYQNISQLFQTEIVHDWHNELLSLLSGVLEADSKAEAPGRADPINNVLISFRLTAKSLTVA